MVDEAPENVNPVPLKYHTYCQPPPLRSVISEVPNVRDLVLLFADINRPTNTF